MAGDVTLGDTMEGLRRILGEGPNLAYLSYMANRLRECWRVLKPTGSIYLHCDPTMSHYLKVAGYPRRKLYLDESKGVPVQDVWNDISSLSGTHKERLGYPTQKPVALLDRPPRRQFWRA